MRYRKISCAFWADERVRTFTDDGKLAFLFLLTHPAMTSVGAMRATMAGLADELGWPRRRLERALAPAVESKMIEVNPAAAYLSLPKFLRHNRPESPNVCKAWGSLIAMLPECPERQATVDRCRAILAEHVEQGDLGVAFGKAFEEGFREAFGKAFRHPFANPEPEQEQEPKQEHEGTSPLPPFKPSGSSSRNGEPGRKPGRKRVDADWGRR
jgi:hypothetical protein